MHHPQCSSALNKNKHVQWMLDGCADISIHVDDGLFSAVNKNKKNYGWIFESSSVIPQVIQRVKGNLDHLFSKFEYIFTHDRQIIELHPNFRFTIVGARPWIQNIEIYPKTKNASFFASSKTHCHGHRVRHATLNKYRQYVDHFGTGYKTQLPFSINFKNITESGKILGMKDYRFSFAIENDSYETLFTEKITDCFATGTIPIYYGPKSIADWFDVNGIIFLDDFKIENLNEEFYNSKMESIKNNLQKVKELPTAEDYIYLHYFK